MYCQSTVLSCVRMLFVLSKYCLDALEGYINRRCVSNMLFQSTKFWGSLLQSYQHSEGVSRYVLSKYQHWLRESRNSGCQVFSNVLVKAPIVNFLRELHLFSVKPVSSFLCLLHTSISFKTVQVLRACKQGTNRFEVRS